MREVTDFLEKFKVDGAYRTPAEALGKPRKNGLLTSLAYNFRGLGGSMLYATWWSHLGKFTTERWAESGLHLLWETERMGT
jgi:hypothetical protein